MSIRNKITLYFSLIIPVITGIAFILIYMLSAENRKEEFHERQKDKILTTLEFLSETRETEEELIESLDRLTINDIYDEKLLLFNNKKELIYSSLDDTPVTISRRILEGLNSDNKWIETKDGAYDVVGTYIENNGQIFYGISKANDIFGHSKITHLRDILIIAFIMITMIIIIVSFYVSKMISGPLTKITDTISDYKFDGSYTPIRFEESKNEISILANQFNKLIKRVNNAFELQKHVVHHISHELKTPIAILVSNFERMEKETDIEKIKTLISHQKQDTKDLGEIINSLLEISKEETGSVLIKEKIRIDELIFDVASELKKVYPEFQFHIEYLQTENEEDLVISANTRLLKACLTNLMVNCIQYSNDLNGRITLGNENKQVILTFENNGETLNEKETQLLFHHFVRGENSKGKRGFGLGLVFVYKIITMHKGMVSYSSPQPNLNQFKISLPLS